MPATGELAYLDHAAVASLPAPTVDAIQKWLAEASLKGGLSWSTWVRDIESMRRGVAEWIHVDLQEVAFVPNTTFGINMVAEGWEWSQGDNVVILADDFPSNRLAWLRLKDRGVDVRQTQNASREWEIQDIFRLMDDRTRLVVVSWVDYGHGRRIDLEALADGVHARGALLFVDAIQGLGVAPLDLRRQKIDFLAADGHKWMLGPEGAGIAVVRLEHLDRLRCTSIGWNSVVSRFDFTRQDQRLRPEAARWEGGSANIAGLLGLKASLELHWQVLEAVGSDAILARVHDLVEDLENRLKGAGMHLQSGWGRARQGGIVNFRHPRLDPAAIRRECLERGVVVNCRRDGIRVSLHAFNDTSDLDRLMEAIPEV